MCINEQLETLHDTMSAHMKTYKMWMSSKIILRFTLLMFFLKARPKKKRKTEINDLEVFPSIVPLFLREQNLEYITLYKILHRTDELKPPLPVCLWIWCTNHTGEQKSPFTWWLHLDPLDSLLDVFQQGFVFWALVLVLIRVDIR